MEIPVEWPIDEMIEEPLDLEDSKDRVNEVGELRYKGYPIQLSTI